MNKATGIATLERRFAEYVNARYAIALCNGTATLHTALAAMGHYGQVAVPPLTMSATTIAVLHAGCTPVFVDVDPDTWLMQPCKTVDVSIPVSLYGLHYRPYSAWTIDDAAQTLRPHSSAAFTSYSFQASKILQVGEGGMLVTDSEAFATRAREFSSLGYRMNPRQPRIDSAVIKHPTYERHHMLGWNYRMNDVTARRAAEELSQADWLKERRQQCADLYREAVKGCSWITPQHVPKASQHDYWAYAVALESAELWNPFAAAIVAHGGEAPYGAWRLTYQEPAFRHLAEPGTCPVAEDLQPRLVQGQTNDVYRCEQNAYAWHAAIKELNG